MIARRLALASAASLAVALPAIPPAWAQQAQPFIGFRNDGTGVWPADCTPVTAWREWDFQERAAPGKRPELVAVRADRRNIVWKVPLKSDCNGGMTLVKGKLYMLLDRGGYDYATQWVPDFVGTRLVCMDPKDGKVLWQKDLDHLGGLPPQEADKARKDVLDYYQWWTKAFGAFNRWHAATRLRSQDRQMTPDRQTEYVEAAKAARALGLPVPATPEDLAKDEQWQRTGGSYNQCAFWGLEKKYFPDRAAQHGRMIQYGYPRERWFGEPSWIGVNMATPVTDSRYIYFSTGNYDAYCVDLEGNVVWCTWIRESRPQGMHGAPSVPSPILTADRLVAVWGDNHLAWLRGLDRRTGKIIWQQSPGASWSSMEKLGVPVGPTGQTMEIIWHGSGGHVYRATDGKQLLKGAGAHSSGRPQGVCGNTLLVSNGWVDGGNPGTNEYPRGLVALRFTAPNEDTLKVECLWSRQDLRWAPTIHKGMVYAHGTAALEVLDLATGQTVGKVQTPRFRVHHLTSIAGDWLFGFDGSGSECLATTLGREAKVVGVNRLGDKVADGRGSFSQGGQPFFSGNRMFYRSYTDVYCIGDANDPMRLSKVHR
jgi:outer membrane protein assembly factor BamB